jgi:hypothetical protein
MPVSTKVLTVQLNQDRRRQVFVAGAVTTQLYTAAGVSANGGWGGWEYLQGPRRVKQVLATQNLDGRLQIFALDDVYGRVAVTAQMALGGDVGPWLNLGVEDVQMMAVGRNADGRLEMFLLMPNGDVSRMWQLEPNSHSWSEGVSFGAVGWTDIWVASNADGRLELFGLIGGDVVHTWQLEPNSHSWSPGVSFGTVGWSNIMVTPNADGRLELFGLIDGDVVHTWQLEPNSEAWNDGISLGTVGWQTFAAISTADGRLDLIGLVWTPPGGVIVETWQLTPGGPGWASSALFQDPEPRPQIDLGGGPLEIKLGAKADLDWSVRYAYSAELSPGIGAVPLTGSVVISPQYTTLYDLKATGLGGVDNASIEITVDQPPSPLPTTVGYSEVWVTNENLEGHDMDVWMHDYTSGGSWQDMAVVASGNQTVRVPFPISGHVYEVRVVDPNRSNCTGNDPIQLNCIAGGPATLLLADAHGQPFPVNVY